MPGLDEMERDALREQVAELRAQLEDVTAERDDAERRAAELDATRARVAEWKGIGQALYDAWKADALTAVDCYMRDLGAALAAVPAAETTSGEVWKYGDVHECPVSGFRHEASTECVTYALKHGDRLYQPD